METKNKINFDSQDWNSIQDTYNKVNEIGCMQLGTTSEGELITFHVRYDHALITEVRQNNGWIRKNIYHLDDYTSEEMYYKEG